MAVSPSRRTSPDHRGWTVQIVKVLKEVWTSPDGRIEFDNEDDYDGYMNNVWWSQLEWEREQEEEWRREQEEAEYCYQRRLAGYDMGYADVGGPPWYATSPLSRCKRLTTHRRSSENTAVLVTLIKAPSIQRVGTLEGGVVYACAGRLHDFHDQQPA